MGVATRLEKRFGGILARGVADGAAGPDLDQARFRGLGRRD